MLFTWWCYTAIIFSFLDVMLAYWHFKQLFSIILGIMKAVVQFVHSFGAKCEFSGTFVVLPGFVDWLRLLLRV